MYNIIKLNKTSIKSPGIPNIKTIKVVQKLIGIIKLKLTANKLKPYKINILKTNFFITLKSNFTVSPPIEDYEKKQSLFYCFTIIKCSF